MAIYDGTTTIFPCQIIPGGAHEGQSAKDFCRTWRAGLLPVLSQISSESRGAILSLCDADDRLHIAKSFSAFRNLCKFQKLDLSFRAMDSQLLFELVSCVVCQASYTRFPASLSSLCNLKELKAMSSVMTLDLTGASISVRGISDLLCACPQLQQLSLEGQEIDGKLFNDHEPMRHLRVLSLVNCAGLSDSQNVSCILRVVPQVTNLDLSNSDISGEGVLVIATEINLKLEVLGLSDLGRRVNVLHLEALGRRCLELKSLNISSTKAAHKLHYSWFMCFAELEELIANMSDGIASLITGDTLLGFKHLPRLKDLHIYRRITMDELVRVLPLDVEFTVTRYNQLVSGRSAGRICRVAAREPNLPFPEHQLTHQDYNGGPEPL